jgi:hypothetical protein
MIGEELVATGPGAEQVELHFLDSVLRLAALAVQSLVEWLGLAFDVRDREARVVALRPVLEPGDHPSFSLPALRRVRELADLKPGAASRSAA